MAEYAAYQVAPAAAARVRGAEFAYPFAVGTIAFVLPNKESATHRWTAYVRGVNNEDISHVVSRVQFTLHETFNNPQRVVSAPPFELTEEGWGEFEIIITIYFQPDSGEPPVELRHHLRLYEDGEPQGAPLPANKKPVISEVVDEFVFIDPSEAFYRRVMATPPRALPAPSVLTGHVGRPAYEGAELARINEARLRVARAVMAIRNAAAMEAHAAQQARAAAAAAAQAAAQGVVGHGQPMAMQ